MKSKPMRLKHLGIDFGSKTAGTTVICWQENNTLRFHQSLKNEDADQLISQFIRELKPDAVFIDAPLSLPMAYRNSTGHSDFFYRVADRATQAMSPLFLGGLTARSMRLDHLHPELPFYEAYPGKLAEIWKWKELGYKKSQASFPLFQQEISEKTGLKMYLPENTHQLDGALAWCIGWRYYYNEVQIFGNPEEGLIYA